MKITNSKPAIAQTSGLAAASRQNASCPLHIITPVKDSIDLSLQTIRSVLASQLSVPFVYTVYNDFSTPENRARLEVFTAETATRIAGGGNFAFSTLRRSQRPPRPTIC